LGLSNVGKKYGHNDYIFGKGNRTSFIASPSPNEKHLIDSSHSSIRTTRKVYFRWVVTRFSEIKY